MEQVIINPMWVYWLIDYIFEKIKEVKHENKN